MAESKMLVLGIGNSFRRDDGIGPAVVSHLIADADLEDIDILDGGTDGVSLLEYLKGYEKALIIDAVDMGMAPGEIRVFSPDEARLIRADALSTHGIGLAEVIGMLKILKIEVELRIIGIQAKDVTFGEGLSPEVSSKIETILELVKEEVTKE